MKKVLHWALVSADDFPRDKWLLVETEDRAHHIAYYSTIYNKWEANSKFGGRLIWWAEVPSATQELCNCPFGNPEIGIAENCTLHYKP